MSSAIKETTEEPDLVGMIASEITRARDETRPTSRQQLADILHARTGMSVADAYQFVDTYCEEHEPGVPGYLQEEFAVPYLKVLGVANAVIALGLCYYGVKLYYVGKPYWIPVCIGVLFLGLGALSWVKSIEREYSRSKKKA
ncbi:hypothetical protein [Fimbriimonas ginsengisoli]|uniref:Uncharacterized protein n=1 Tax=Fimbriimonas ginsengisoli Gsoil 348 TaxID=661478 RepID=A0A068NT87_FIMGI|nr:hypothetical protein [Fimbriimonas ginsengisoli]AIE84844.1 hypothetical protein OP10G_1476 [Fimbriimonas ginsengisoli Gsoil 348]